MNVMVPIAASVRSERSEPVRRVSQGSAREIWEERRRAIERLGRSFTPEGSRSDWQSALFGYGAIAFECAARLLGFHGRGRRNALDPRLVEIAFSFPDLPPAFEGYRILHLSDTHFDCLPELAEIARALVSGLEVDLLALTGDIQGSKRAAFAESTAPLRRLIEAVRVTDRKLAVLGNHDPAAMAGVLERSGLEVLLNRSVVVERDGQRLVVTGLDDVHRFYTPAAARALADAPDGFRLALVHSGEMADHAAAAGTSLYLCGHTHGGQICLPGGRPIFTRLRRCRFAARGEWRLGPMVGYTSAGLGVGDVSLRFNCRGEIAVISLRRHRPEGWPFGDESRALRGGPSSLGGAVLFPPH